MNAVCKMNANSYIEAASVTSRIYAIHMRILYKIHNSDSLLNAHSYSVKHSAKRNMHSVHISMAPAPPNHHAETQQYHVFGAKGSNRTNEKK